MSGTFKHPTVSEVLTIHAAVLQAHGGSEGVRSNELLESAIAAPQATMFGRAIITDVVEVAAAYLFYLCSNHPFVDGNKRTALATCFVFLAEHGFLANRKVDLKAWESLTLAVASSLLTREEIAAELRKLVG